ncbi:MAG: 2-amino-4-hydroxy-6-hydroxymethyldihydropteridine diphosphokinase, partial [Thiohalophilus sp.]
LDLQEQGIDIPRQEILHNAFVLQPLAEIAPQLKHPQTEQTMTELWQQFDKQSQSLWPIAFNW